MLFEDQQQQHQHQRPNQSVSREQSSEKTKQQHVELIYSAWLSPVGLQLLLGVLFEQNRACMLKCNLIIFDIIMTSFW